MDDKLHIGPDEEAARWHARMLAEDCSQADRHVLDAWLNHSPHHADAYSRVGHILSAVESAQADPRLQLLADQAFEESKVIPKKRATVWPAALAASLALVAITFVSIGTPEEVASIVYETSQQRSTIVLDDGSKAVMDVGTRIAVRMTDRAREIELIAGRAFFDVAHDKQRPFSVDANESRTTALGTRFQVELNGQGVSVVLEEGSIAVEQLAAGPARAWSERLQPGEQIVIDSASGSRLKRLVDADIATSWTLNRHVFRDTRLEEAVAEINRYSSKNVRLGDPSLADLHLAGSFIAGDSEQIMAAVASVLPVRVVSAGEHEIVLFRRYSEIEQDRP
jgi:transmembrane sensor